MAQLAARQIVALEVVRSKLTCVNAFVFDAILRRMPSCMTTWVNCCLQNRIASVDRVATCPVEQI